MQRISTPNAAPNLFGPGKSGWQPGNPVTGALATQFSYAWLNSVQEELANILEGLGIALDPTLNNQIISALLGKFLALSGGTVTGNLTVQGGGVSSIGPYGFTSIGLGPIAAENGAGNGQAWLVPGTNLNSGLVQFIDPTGARTGYAGWSDGGGNPTLTGDSGKTWILPQTPALGDNSLRIPNTAWVQAELGALLSTRPGHTYTANDWCYLDKQSGLILQWLSQALPTGNGDVVSLPQTFTSMIFGAVGMDFGVGCNSLGWQRNGASLSTIKAYGKSPGSGYAGTAWGAWIMGI